MERPSFKGNSICLDKVHMLDRTRRRSECPLAFNEFVQGFIDLVLQTEASAHFLGVELGAGEVVHDLPIAVAGPDVLEALLADVANVEFFIFLVEKHSAGGHETGAGNLKQEWRAVASLVATGARGFDFAPLNGALVGIGGERLGLAQESVKAGIAAVIDAQVPVLIVAAMLDHEVVHAQFPSEAGERENLVGILRHEHHLKADRASELIAALHSNHVGDVLNDAVEPFLFHAHDLGVAFFLAGGDVDPEVGEMWEELLGFAFCEHEAVRAAGH